MTIADTRSPFAGLLAGLLGGAVATLVLDLYLQGSLKAMQAVEDAAKRPRRLSGQQQAQILGYQYAHAETASRLAQLVTGKNLLREHRATAAPFVHYGFGALAGAVYGIAAEYLPDRTGYGAAFGTLLYAGGAEAALPALALSPSPRAIPLSIHVGGWIAHMVYGVTLEGMRRLIRAHL